jgi:hypothetical protein
VVSSSGAEGSDDSSATSSNTSMGDGGPGTIEPVPLVGVMTLVVPLIAAFLAGAHSRGLELGSTVAPATTAA